MAMKVISFPCFEIQQPIGKFYVGVINSNDLRLISYADVRRIVREKRDLDTYLGIQRELNSKRVKEIAEYVKTVDACFPTSIILSIKSKYAKYDEKGKVMQLSNPAEGDDKDQFKAVAKIAKVLDGQHRIEGLYQYKKGDFNLSISIFIDMDIDEQAYIFSLVNLTQTKVNRSLAIDLFDYAKSRSPQKLCHVIAVTLDSTKESPFYKSIKRLGKATEGRSGETITQATLSQMLMPYLTTNAMQDRDIYKKGKVPEKVNDDESRELIFRNMMIDEKDMEIVDVLWNYFSAIRKRWPKAWASTGMEFMLNKTNGFRAFMKFLNYAYLFKVKPGKVPTENEFSDVMNRISIKDEDFNTDNFKPGTSGEATLVNRLLDESKFRDLVKI